MKRKSILIVDDESYIREFLAQILSEHFKVFFAKNSEEAISAVKTTLPDIILLDVLMPGLNGIETCKLIRKNSESKNIPVIMVTALEDIEQKIKAFQAGADDYLAKPFLPEELIARIVRKLESQSYQEISKNENQIQFGNLKLKFDSLSLEIDGDSYDLGQIEYKILNFLLKKSGALVSRQELNVCIWGNDPPSDRALDPHITSLRKKLQKSQGILKTVYSKGYSLVLKEMGT